MTDLNRRRLLQLMGTAPLAAGFVWTATEVVDAAERSRAVRQTGTPYAPQFFTAHEYATVVLLADLIIPADDRSGSASDAGVPEFIDFMMIDQPSRQIPVRGGLAWVDQECTSRFGQPFVKATDAERHQVLDEISGLEPARPDQSHGVAFFRAFRDLTATGFWTSKMGIDDLQFMGNTLVAEWKGCPPEALAKLGLDAE